MKGPALSINTLSIGLAILVTLGGFLWSVADHVALAEDDHEEQVDMAETLQGVVILLERQESYDEMCSAGIVKAQFCNHETRHPDTLGEDPAEDEANE